MFVVCLAASSLPTTASAQASCATTPPGLVGWWRAELNTADALGINPGDTPFGIEYAPGKVGYAFRFNRPFSSQRRVSIPDHEVFMITNSLTIEGWIRIEGDNGFIFARSDNRDGFDPYLLKMGPPGTIQFAIGSGTERADLFAPIAYDEWKHVAATLEGGTGDMKLFIDGVLAAQTNTSVRPMRELNPDLQPAIGIGNSGGTFFVFPFYGLIDEMSLYSRALSPEQVQAIYAAGAAGKCGVPEPPSILAHPQSQTVMASTYTTFAVTASGTAPLSYQWFFNGAEIPGATSAEFAVPDAQPENAGSYHVVVTNLFGLAVSSNALLFISEGPPIILAQPQNAIVAESANAVFEVTVSGGEPMQFQWRFNGTNLPAATNSTLVITSVDAVDAGIYRVHVTNAVGFAISSNATLTITAQAPAIVSHPQSAAVEEFAPVTLAATASGSAPLRYQWRHNGTNVAGATNSVLTISNVLVGHEGLYSLAVSNAGGLAISSNALLTVLRRPVQAWGNNDFGQSGILSFPTNVALIAAGGYHTLTVREDGSLTVWGNNFNGQASVPSDLTNAVAIAGGGYHSLALQTDGRVFAWGENIAGQTNVPSHATNLIAVAAGESHSLGLRANGRVIGWGDNSWGQITVPPDLTNVVAIAAGNHHSLALKTDGTVVAWGSNLGPFGAYAGQRDVPFGLNRVRAIAAGGFHSLALRTNGAVVAWGDNTWGQRTVPSGVTNAIAVSAGAAHSVALRQGGFIVAWGNNSYGQGTPPPALSGVTAIASGGYHNLALLGKNPVPFALQTPFRFGTTTAIPLATTRGKNYFLYYKTSLFQANWNWLGGITGDGGVRTAGDSTATNAVRFYRVREQ